MIRHDVRRMDDHEALAAQLLRMGHPETIRELGCELRRLPTFAKLVWRYRRIEARRLSKIRVKH